MYIIVLFRNINYAVLCGKIHTHKLQHAKFCYRICGIMKKSIISPTQCYSAFIRHTAENRRRVCFNMRFSTLFVIRRYTIVARQLYVTSVSANNCEWQAKVSLESIEPSLIHCSAISKLGNRCLVLAHDITMIAQ